MRRLTDGLLNRLWSDPDIQRECQDLAMRLGPEETERTEHVVLSRDLIESLPNYEQAVLEALRARVAELVAKYPGRVGW